MIADDLVAKLQAAQATCTGYFHWDYPLLSSDYAAKGLPVPVAAAACTGAADEDLTIEVFADEAAKDRFVASKRRLLCDAAARNDLDFLGFPYVDGGTWLFEPDEATTAAAAQKILGGTVAHAGCDARRSAFDAAARPLPFEVTGRRMSGDATRAHLDEVTRWRLVPIPSPEASLPARWPVVAKLLALLAQKSR